MVTLAAPALKASPVRLCSWVWPLGTSGEIRKGTVVSEPLESFLPRASVLGTGWAVGAGLTLSRVIFRVT